MIFFFFFGVGSSNEGISAALCMVHASAGSCSSKRNSFVKKYTQKRVSFPFFRHLILFSHWISESNGLLIFAWITAILYAHFSLSVVVQLSNALKIRIFHIPYPPPGKNGEERNTEKRKGSRKDKNQEEKKQEDYQEEEEEVTRNKQQECVEARERKRKTSKYKISQLSRK